MAVAGSLVYFDKYVSVLNNWATTGLFLFLIWYNIIWFMAEEFYVFIVQSEALKQLASFLPKDSNAIPPINPFDRYTLKAYGELREMIRHHWGYQRTQQA